MRIIALLALVTAPCLAFAEDAATRELGNPEVGAELYRSFCLACHGADATGGGEMAEILTVPPSDLTSLSAENNGVFPIARVAQQIDGRDPLLAHGGVMPLFGGFFAGDDVAIPSEAGQPILTSRPIADLTSYLATVQN